MLLQIIKVLIICMVFMSSSFKNLADTSNLHLRAKFVTVTCNINIKNLVDNSLSWDVELDEYQKDVNGVLQRNVDIPNTKNLQKTITLNFADPVEASNSNEQNYFNCNSADYLSLVFSAKDQTTKEEELGAGRIPKLNGSSYFLYYVTYSQEWLNKISNNWDVTLPALKKEYQGKPIIPLDGDKSNLLHFKSKNGTAELNDLTFNISLVANYVGDSAPTVNTEDETKNRYSSLISITASYE